MEKYAVIVLETFKAKLNIVTVKDNNYYDVIDSEVEPVNFVLDEESNMFLSKAQIDNAVRVLKNYRKICEMHKIDKTFAIATFAGVNKPKNLNSFFEEVFNFCGFRFEAISLEDQNELLYSSIINTIDAPKGMAIMISPNSVHIIQYNRRVLINQINLDFGTLDLANMFPLDEGVKEENLVKMAEYVEKKVDEVEFLNNLYEDINLVGVGDYFEDLTTLTKKMIKYPLNLVNGFILKTDDVKKVYSQVTKVDVDKTRKIKGTKEARADLLVASMIIFNAVAKKLNCEKATVSTKGLTEGIIFSNCIELAIERAISDVLGYSLTNIIHVKDEENVAHDEQVYNMAILLFKQLRVLHKLPRGYTRILRIASLLHDFGAKIGYPLHAKTGFSAVLGSEVMGATHREMVLAGFVVSLHCGGDIPVSEFVRYHELITEEDIEAVKKLGIILRMAEAFDRLRNNIIIDLNCDILGDSVILKTIATGDNSFEISKALEVEKDFERCFGKKVEIL